MFDIDTIETEELEKELNTYKKRAFPFATKATVNDLAWTTRRISQKQIGRKFTERNKFTKGSVMVNQARTLNVDNQRSEVGSVQDYMREQEEGATQTSTGKHGKAIPTSYAAGQKGAQPRTKVPRKRNRIQNIVLKRRLSRGKAGRKQNLVAAMNVAVKDKMKFIFLQKSIHGVKTGIFNIKGGKYSGRGWPGNAKINMVQSLEKRSIRINPTKWLEPSSMLAIKQSDKLYRKNLLFQLRRHRLLGY